MKLSGKKTILFLCCLSVQLYLSVHLKAQSEQIIDPAIRNGKWKAAWITYPGVSLKDYGVYHFRKTIDLAGKPEKFIIHISGDNRYKLYVNGREVCNGPARGDLMHWRFETIDISPQLNAGKNVLAAVVWNFAEYAPLAQVTNKTAFIVQGNSQAEALVNTGSSWKTYHNAAYIPPVKKPLRTVVGPGDHVEGSKYPYGWENKEFNDDTWLAPRMLGDGIPYGKFGDWDWLLVPRNIPLMEQTFQRIPKLRRTEHIAANEKFLDGSSPLRIGPHQKIKILTDQTHLTTAYPELIVSGGKGSVIQLGYAEALVNEKGEKANRNDIQGKRMDSDFQDIFLPDGLADRHFRPLWFRTFRYLELDIETKDEPLVIKDLYSYYTGYPFKENASFKSSDSTLEQIWKTGWRTARLCAGETYFDCPYYEQLQYIGDTRIQSLISLYVSGDDRLMKNAITQFRESVLPIGLTQSRYPSSQPQVIPPFSLFWIGMVHDYFMHRNDPVFVKQQLNGIRNVLSWYEQQVAENGMLRSDDWWNFIDWSFEPWNDLKPIGGAPKNIHNGNSSILTLQYVNALQMAAGIFKAEGDSSQAGQYLQTAELLLKKTRDLCWNDQKHLLADAPEQASYSQHANILAVLTGMFSKEEEKKLMYQVLHDQTITQATLYFKFYLARALDKCGLGDEYIGQLGPWKEMIKLGLSTFAETPEPSRSDCHAWSASPNYDFLATVCGIKPGSPGFQTVNISPHLGPLDFAEGNVPHPNGEIQVSLKRQPDHGLNAKIVLPPGLSGIFIWNQQKTELHPGVQVLYLR